MKLQKNIPITALFYGTLAVAPINDFAATVWNGPLITYTQPAPDPTQATNRDQLTPGVSLTRAVSAGMFNGVTETNYTHNVSPADTEWAVGALSNYTTLTFADWETTGGGNPVINLPGQQLVAHLISDNIYLSLKFTSLGGHGAGGFSYQRSTSPGSSNAPPNVSIISPTSGTAFLAPASVPILATANDPNGSVTNVSFFDGTTLLGSTNNMPYSLTASLAVGVHALSAVATDNLGLSATSSVVNVTAQFHLNVAHGTNNVDISWPVAGGRLQSQTNSLGTNWFDVPNSTQTNRIVFPVDPANRSVFYRLAVP